MKFIDAESVAEALVNIFTKVRVPSEILSDQGLQYLSRVMKEVGRLEHSTTGDDTIPPHVQRFS